MFTVELSAGAIFTIGAVVGAILGLIGIVVVAVTLSKKSNKGE